MWSRRGDLPALGQLTIVGHVGIGSHQSLIELVDDPEEASGRRPVGDQSRWPGVRTVLRMPPSTG